MSAVVAFAAPAPVPEDGIWLQHAIELSRSAGPDGAGAWLEGSHGLGYARLQTGVETETDPITLDGRIWLTADVRLDAREELIRALPPGRAALKRSCSDAELVLHAYVAWGERFLDHLAGDFAFALWDGDLRRLICARDQLGVVPLYYATAGDRLLVASVVDALLVHPAVSDDLNEVAIADFLRIGYYGERSATAFAAVRQLPPAHVLTWSAEGVRVRRYWRPDAWEPLVRFTRPEEAGELFRELLDDAVADRLTADRATVQLSGGMDSTSLAASAALAFRARRAPADALRAFTGVLGTGSGDREGEFSALVARELGLPIDALDESAMPPLDPFGAPPLFLAEPTGYQFTNFGLEYARLPARHAPVALSGHGGDALLAFVPWYWVEWLARGRALRVTRAFADQVRLGGGRPRPHARSILRTARGVRRSGGPESPPWFRPPELGDTSPPGRGWRLAAPELSANAFPSNPIWPELFRRGDPSFTREPVRFRYPFADLRLLRFVRSLPPDPWLVNKRVLRDSASGRLPESVRRRPKTPLVRVVSIIPADAAGDLTELVRRCPELDRFLDPAALVAGLLGAAAGSPLRQHQLRWALGLAHWLWHRGTAPQAARSQTNGEPARQR